MATLLWGPLLPFAVNSKAHLIARVSTDPNAKPFASAIRHSVDTGTRVTLGTMTGLALARALSQRRPAQPIVPMTGYTAEIKNALASGVEVLPRPCVPERLAEAIAAVRMRGERRGRQWGPGDGAPDRRAAPPPFSPLPGPDLVQRVLAEQVLERIRWQVLVRAGTDPGSPSRCRLAGMPGTTGSSAIAMRPVPPSADWPKDVEGRRPPLPAMPPGS